MHSVRSQPGATPLTADVRRRVQVVLDRAAAMGLIEPSAVSGIGADDAEVWDALQRAVSAARERGVGIVPGSYVRSTSPRTGLEPDIVRRVLDDLAASLEGSPLPAREIPELARVLGWPLLGRLTGAAEVSLRRYANDKREAPDELAEKVHWLALMVADLRGGYNEFGVRRWMERPRAQLGGMAPLDLLQGDWSPHDGNAQRLRDLAAWVAQPTAAS